MKKIITSILLSMMLVLMTACQWSTSPKPDKKDDSSLLPTIYELLEDCTEQEYLCITVNITTSTEFAEVHANYVLTQSVVTYEIERLNLLPIDGDLTDLPSSYKTTLSGSALIEDGEVVELDGDKDVTIPSIGELKGAFNFDESNLKNVIVGTNSFKADVVSPSLFYGTDVEVNNLRVNVEYAENAFIGMIVSYTTISTTIRIEYVFEK